MVGKFYDLLGLAMPVIQKGPGFFGECRFNAAPPMQLTEADQWQIAEQCLVAELQGG